MSTSTSVSNNDTNNKRSRSPNAKTPEKKKRVSRFNDANEVDWEEHKTLLPDQSTSTSKFEYNKLGLDMILKSRMSITNKE